MARRSPISTRNEGPLIIATATDISSGARFPFNQGFFDILCSDLGAVRLSRAAASSSAVPVVLSPVTINNYGGTCNYAPPAWMRPFVDTPKPPRPAARAIRELRKAERRSTTASSGRTSISSTAACPTTWRMRGVLDALESLEALCQLDEAHAARPCQADHRLRRQLAVDAADELGRVRQAARYLDILLKATGVPIDALLVRGDRAPEGHHRAVGEPSRRIRESRRVRRQQGSGGRRRAAGARCGDLRDRRVVSRSSGPVELDYLNEQPTSFALPPEAVDRLRAAAGTIIMASPEFQRLLKDVGVTIVPMPTPPTPNKDTRP